MRVITHTHNKQKQTPKAVLTWWNPLKENKTKTKKESWLEKLAKSLFLENNTSVAVQSMIWIELGKISGPGPENIYSFRATFRPWKHFQGTFQSLKSLLCSYFFDILRFFFFFLFFIFNDFSRYHEGLITNCDANALVPGLRGAEQNMVRPDIELHGLLVLCCSLRSWSFGKSAIASGLCCSSWYEQISLHKRLVLHLTISGLWQMIWVGVHRCRARVAPENWKLVWFWRRRALLLQLWSCACLVSTEKQKIKKKKKIFSGHFQGFQGRGRPDIPLKKLFRAWYFP